MHLTSVKSESNFNLSARHTLRGASHARQVRTPGPVASVQAPSYHVSGPNHPGPTSEQDLLIREQVMSDEQIAQAYRAIECPDCGSQMDAHVDPEGVWVACDCEAGYLA